MKKITLTLIIIVLFSIMLVGFGNTSTGGSYTKAFLKILGTLYVDTIEKNTTVQVIQQKT